MRNRRDPFQAAKSGEGDPYTPIAKAERAERTRFDEFALGSARNPYHKAKPVLGAKVKS